MGTKKEFKLKFEPIIQYLKEYENAQKGLELLSSDSFPEFNIGTKLLDSYIALLSDICNDTSSWISYYVWDCDMGKKDMIITINNKGFILKSIEDLYDLIFEKDS